MDDLISEFITETVDNLNDLDTALLDFEAHPDNRTLLDKIFRTLHTIKGTCGFLGLPRLEAVAHTAETLLDRFRKEPIIATSHDVNLILLSLDLIRTLLDNIQETGQEGSGDDTPLLNDLQKAIDRPAVVEVKATVIDTRISTENQTPKDPFEGIDFDDIPMELLPKAAASSQDAKNNEVSVAQVEPTSATKSENAATLPLAPVIQDEAPSQNSASQAANQFLKIHVDTLEDMLTKVSELVLTRNQLAEITKNTHDENLQDSLQRLNSVVGELQNSVMKARMQPIGNAWQKFPRVVRDIARDLNKKIRLDMIGEDCDIDRQVLEAIKDPLMHMIRNSADHGIETIDDRIAAGKSDTGVITLQAYHEGGYVCIEIRDDGKGIDPARIREVTVKRGLLTEDQAYSISDDQILNYIFAPGFSTAAAVTSVSGRGVGMDVVRTNIEKIGGTVDLSSVVGKGSRFIIRIPLTLAIVSALLVKCLGQRYAIPQLSVDEIIRVHPDNDTVIELAGARPTIRYRNQLLPIIALRELLYGRDTIEGKANYQDCYIVVAKLGATHYGLIVDEIWGAEDIVVKPLSASLKNVPLFSGNTILGDGRVILIVDPASVAAQANILASAQAAQIRAQEKLDGVHQSDDVTSVLLLRAGDAAPKAIPAFLVTRIETFDRSRIEYIDNRPMIQHQGRAIDLHAIGAMPKGDYIKTLIFNDDQFDLIFGIMVDEVIDIVEAPMNINADNRRAGILGTEIIRDRVTEIIDLNYYTGEKDWMPQHDVHWPHQGSLNRHILLVDDSSFFRHMLKPLLTMAGYEVTVAKGPLSALALFDKGMIFDLIVSDIEMDEMSGLEFAETVKSDSRWQHIPMVALSSRASPSDIELGYNKGFTAYVSKSDRDALLTTLRDVFEKQAEVRS